MDTAELKAKYGRIGFEIHDSRINDADLKHCVVCGREVSRKWNYCTACGAPVSKDLKE